MQPLARARDADVEQAALLSRAARLSRAHLVRQQVLLHARDEHGVVLEPLRGVQGHERHGAARVIEVVSRGDERHLGEEVDEAALRVVLLKLAGHRHELLHVLGARFVLRVAAAAQQLEVLRLLEDSREDVRHQAGVERLARRVEDRGEVDDGGGHFRSEAEGGSIPQRIDHGAAQFVGVVRERRLRRGPDTALGCVEDAPHGEAVGRVRDGDEVRHHVLDLGALVELRAAEHAVRDRRADEDLLQRSRLRVGAVEHGDLVVRRASLVQRADLVGDELRLVVLAVAGEADDLLA